MEDKGVIVERGLRMKVMEEGEGQIKGWGVTEEELMDREMEWMDRKQAPFTLGFD